MNYFPVMSREEFRDMYPQIHQQVCEELGLGFVPNIFRCLANTSPELASASWTMVRNNLCTGSIPRVTKELMFAYIAKKRQCDYCQIAHHALAVHHGFTTDHVSQVINNIHLIDNPTLKAVLGFADLATHQTFTNPAEVYHLLDELGFDAKEKVELLGMISCAVYMVNIADGLAVSIDQDFINLVA